MPPYSILMFLFAAGLLLYAGLMALTKNFNMLPRQYAVSVKPEDKKAYTFQLAKVIALTAVAPALSGITAIWSGAGAVVVLIACIVAVIYLGTKIMKNVM